MACIPQHTGSAKSSRSRNGFPPPLHESIPTKRGTVTMQELRELFLKCICPEIEILSKRLCLKINEVLSQNQKELRNAFLNAVIVFVRNRSVSEEIIEILNIFVSKLDKINEASQKLSKVECECFLTRIITDAYQLGGDNSIDKICDQVNSHSGPVT